jgi:hypothetical protein
MLEPTRPPQFKSTAWIRLENHSGAKSPEQQIRVSIKKSFTKNRLRLAQDGLRFNCP